MPNANILPASLSRRFLPLTALLACAAGTAQAVVPVAPVLSFTINASEASPNLTLLPQSNQIGMYNSSDVHYSDYQNTDTPRTVIQTAPTATTPGLAYDYIDHTYSYKQTSTSYYVDTLSSQVSVDDTQLTTYNGQKYLILSGTVTSSIDTSLSFSLAASGHYMPTITPFGATTPALPSYFFGSSMASLTSLAMSSNSGDKNYNSWSNSALALSANVGTTFYAAVLAGDNVSLSDFSLYASSGWHDTTTTVTPYSQTTSEMIGARVLPVPEADTYAMLLTGLGLIGFMARRRKNPLFS